METVVISIVETSDLSLTRTLDIVDFDLETVPPSPGGSGGILSYQTTILIHHQSQIDPGRNCNYDRIIWIVVYI